MLTRETDVVVALAGNPNVGKSSIFNALTGMKQHTGNWAGKTVSTAFGRRSYGSTSYVFVDLPGTYSLFAKTPEEEISRDFIYSGKAAVTVVVCDATSPERTLLLAIQTLQLTSNVVVCLNLIDEAEKLGIKINTELLSARLNVPVIATSARSKMSADAILSAIETVLKHPTEPAKPDLSGCNTNEEQVRARISFISNVCDGAITSENLHNKVNSRSFDKIVTHKYFAFPIMLLMLLGVLWLTISGANYPSQWLESAFSHAERWLSGALLSMKLPDIVRLPLVEGMFRTLGWVVSVMLPPMAIFFPLFTILEDFGLLPRFAFNLDSYFNKCCACGKQGLTMCIVYI